MVVGASFSSVTWGTAAASAQLRWNGGLIEPAGRLTDEKAWRTALEGVLADKPVGPTLRHRADLLVELVRHDVVVAYQGSVLGIAWTQVTVLVQFGILAILFTQVVDLGIEHYPAFLLAGLVPWQMFSDGLNGATTSMAQGRALLRSPRVPAWMLPATAIGAALVRFVLSLPLLLVLVVAFTGELPVTVTALPLVVATHVLLLVGPGLLLAAAHVRWRDVGHLVALMLVPLFWATPIFYPASRVPDRFEIFVTLNPMAHVVEAYRDILVDGHWPGVDLVALAALSLAVLVVAARVVVRVRSQLVDVL